LIGRPTIQAKDNLRQLLLEELSFEAALARAQEPPFTSTDCQTFERALMDEFLAMDRGLSGAPQYPLVNIYKVQDFIFRFWGGKPGARVDAGYMFTLNQDLWPERFLYNWHTMWPHGGVRIAMPGVRPRANHEFFTTDLGHFTNSFLRDTVQNSAEVGRLAGSFNVIKLHGSFNWTTNDDRNAMVMGTQKAAQITRHPLLSWYWQVFEQVLAAGDVRLMIVGYGFGDEHVNRVIADAIERQGLKVFIWDSLPAGELKDRLCAAPHGKSIWKGLLSTASRPLIEVFPGDQSETEEYRRIVQTFF
jgi:hypothetical protein